MGKHGPNSFANYQEVHNKRIRQALDGGFLVFDGLAFDALGDNLIVLEGELRCVGDITIDVLKTIRILGGQGATARVQSESYRYHAHIKGIGNILRYDSPHRHHPHHHVHRYDVLKGDKEGSRFDLVQETERPTLGEVIDELNDWYYANFAAIEELVRVRNAL